MLPQRKKTTNMNIISEIGLKITRHVLQYLNNPSDHPRPQDDVPEETILRHLYADYRKLSEERSTLINYIRQMENIYKQAQGGLLDIVLYKKDRHTKKRILQELQLIAYHITKDHLKAQQQLRIQLGVTDEQKEESV